MKKYPALFLFFMTSFHMITAQQKSPVGSYMLQGVREMASGFELKPDSTFQFFFSYGALDRYGSGTWKQKDNQIIFNSKPFPGKDFKLINSSKTTDAFILLRLDLKNPQLYNYMYAYSGRLKEGDYPVRANADGIIKLPLTTDSIHLLFEFVPERISVFSLNTKEFNHFTFTIEPWITDVFFTDFTLRITDTKLEGRHPLLSKEDCEYIKEK